MSDDKNKVTPPELELALEVKLKFSVLPKVENLPAGGARSAVKLESGSFKGPKLSGKAIASSGGDFAHFRPDGVIALDARYMLQEDDETPIMLTSRGYLWGNTPEVMERFGRIAQGLSDEDVYPDEYYFRTLTTFEVPVGKHDWLARYSFVGSGERTKNGNIIRYFMVK